MHKTIEAHLSAIRAGEITKTNVIGIRKALNAALRNNLGFSNGRTSPKVTQREAIALETALESVEPHAVGELHESGLKVLRNRRYKSRWNERQQGIIDRLHHFSLVRFDYIGDRGYQTTPVYRAVDATGQSFLFRNIPWQTAFALGEESGPKIVGAEQ